MLFSGKFSRGPTFFLFHGLSTNRKNYTSKSKLIMGVSVYICENYTCKMVKIDHPRKLNLTKISHCRVATYICCYEQQWEIFVRFNFRGSISGISSRSGRPYTTRWDARYWIFSVRRLLLAKVSQLSRLTIAIIGHSLPSIYSTQWPPLSLYIYIYHSASAGIHNCVCAL